MANWYHFRVVAWLSDGRHITTPMPHGTVSARDPESAARKWYWLLPEAERTIVDRVIIWAPDKPTGATPAWDGPTIIYRPIDGRMVEVERR